MTSAEMEAVYDAMARQIDKAGPGKSEVFLAKLALLLAQKAGDVHQVLDAVSEAGESL
ncbi:hypothetical protein SAMN05421641_12927 [Paracoccus thiocyanatus]|uniref:DUF2783 domain-containing protein n=1 Tax=Paracoccus thiocyanatus TaxID=34006 RepID=A0A1N6YWN4_9RHOB|nr:DUF2783 domain-containing protein [Paracoccus thiocyanatus]SIR19013.1 hypothetical protein SAMN05421641_12927 [Paracoccus thiocyanatus]